MLYNLQLSLEICRRLAHLRLDSGVQCVSHSITVSVCKEVFLSRQVLPLQIFEMLLSTRFPPHEVGSIDNLFGRPAFL